MPKSLTEATGPDVLRQVDDKSRQSYFDCVLFTRACLKHEMTK